LIDQEIFDIFKISRDLVILIQEWRKIRLPLDRPATSRQVTRNPTTEEFLVYAQEIQLQLDGFMVGRVHHRITLTHSAELTECKIEQLPSDSPFPIGPSCIQLGDRTISNVMNQLAAGLRQKLSQWVYVQRGLRLYEGDTIFLYKPSRLIDWTGTQAMIDATEIIGEVIASRAD